MKVGWLVNDQLTGIPGTKTFWHDLLNNINGLVDKTDGYTDYFILADKIEKEITVKSPDYIIRNATYFRYIYAQIKTISLLQDIRMDGLKNMQIDVCKKSVFTVFNSNYSRSFYPEIDNFKIIPLGVDDTKFVDINVTNEERKELNIKDDCILYIGDSSNNPKGFDKVIDLINKTDYNFCLVMKDDFKIDNPRVTVFNKIDHTKLVKIMNSCMLGICTSVIETQHLSGIEAMFTNLPMIATNVGIYYDFIDGKWGHKAESTDDFIRYIEIIKSNTGFYSPREFILGLGLDKKSCMLKWNALINNL